MIARLTADEIRRHRGRRLQAGNFQSLRDSLHAGKELFVLQNGRMRHVRSAEDMPSEEEIEYCIFYEFLPLDGFSLCNKDVAVI